MSAPSVQSSNRVGAPECCMTKYQSHEFRGLSEVRLGPRMTNSWQSSSSTIRSPLARGKVRYSFGLRFQPESLCPRNHGPQDFSFGNQFCWNSVARVKKSEIFRTVFSLMSMLEAEPASPSGSSLM